MKLPQRIQPPYIAIIGGANIDIHGTPCTGLRKHDSNPGTVNTSAGGVARNIAENLARLGADCRLIAPIGIDPHGQFLLQQGEQAGIDMRHMQQFETASTSSYLSILDDGGDMFVGIADMSILELFKAEHLRPHEKMLRQASLVIADTNLTDSALGYLTSICSEQALFVDTVSTSKAARIKPYLAAVHTLKASLIEARALAGIDAPTEQHLPELAAWFHARGVSRLFISLAARGVFYSAEEGQGIEETAQTAQPLVNAGGAGDAFLAGLAHAWLGQWQLRKSVHFAMSAATLTLTSVTTVSPEMSIAAAQNIYEQHYAGQ